MRDKRTKRYDLPPPARSVYGLSHYSI